MTSCCARAWLACWTVPCPPSWRIADTRLRLAAMRTRYARWPANPVSLLQCVIVDDDASFLEAAQALLEEDGVRVAGTASTRADAVQRVAALHPDVVLIDM